MTNTKKISIILILVGLIAIYKLFDPTLVSDLFPKCPFYVLTNFKCPGCGSQRAIHQLLNGNFVSAFYANPLLIAAIPYLILGYLFEYGYLKSFALSDSIAILYGKTAILVVFLIVVLFFILRNVF